MNENLCERLLRESNDTVHALYDLLYQCRKNILMSGSPTDMQLDELIHLAIRAHEAELRYESLVDTYIKGVSAERVKPEWIPLSLVKPTWEDGGPQHRVLGYSDGFGTIHEYPVVDLADGNYTVTHWMPFPVPPESV